MQYPLSAIALEKARGIEEVAAAVELLLQEIVAHAQQRILDSYEAGCSVVELKSQVEVLHRKMLDDPSAVHVAFYRGALRGLGRVLKNG